MLLHPELKTGKFLQAGRRDGKDKWRVGRDREKRDYKADLRKGLRKRKLRSLVC